MYPNYMDASKSEHKSYPDQIFVFHYDHFNTLPKKPPI